MCSLPLFLCSSQAQGESRLPSALLVDGRGEKEVFHIPAFLEPHSGTLVEGDFSAEQMGSQVFPAMPWQIVGFIVILRLEKPSKVRDSNHSPWHCQPMFPGTTSTQLLDPFRDRHSTTALSRLLQCPEGFAPLLMFSTKILCISGNYSF